MNYCEVKVVIGSWGSYNACNKRALGSSWIDLSDYSDWIKIEEELERQGFELDGIDEELFIQDIEDISDSGTNWDYVNPKNLFETLKESGVLDDEYKYNTFLAYLEVRSLSEFEELVNRNGYCWDDDICIYRNYDWEDYGREMFEVCGYQVDESIMDFFNFEAYGRYMGEYVKEFSGGLIEINT